MSDLTQVNHGGIVSLLPVGLSILPKFLTFYFAPETGLEKVPGSS